MAQTRALLAATFTVGLDRLIWAYFGLESDVSSMEAAERGEYEHCTMILKSWVKGPYDLRSINSTAEGVLMGACMGGYPEIAELALKHGASDEYTGMKYACATGQIEMVRMMMAHGVRVPNGGLWQACATKHQDIVRLMIASGATSCECGESMEAHLAGLTSGPALAAARSAGLA